LANTREIRRRIKSVKNTQQITKAMQMVAASKMRRAQQAAVAGREYSSLLNRVLVSLRERVESGSHPLLAERPGKRELVILISTDKGLCGALNSNLFRETSQLVPGSTVFEVTGRKGVQYVARTGRELLADFPLPDNPTLTQTRALSRFALDRFLAGDVDKVTIAYTKFVNTLTQKPTLQTLLPVAPSKLDAAGHPVATISDESVAKYPAENPKNRFGYIFEPGPAEVLDGILPEYVHFQVYQMILDSRASEHSARMVAMKNATDNAKQIIKDLTLEYNKVRQAAITTELLEITTAQMAMA
jgi:F-type H+-transporting ATPase subunit gamma